MHEKHPSVTWVQMGEGSTVCERSQSVQHERNQTRILLLEVGGDFLHFHGCREQTSGVGLQGLRGILRPGEQSLDKRIIEWLEEKKSR